jgi:hypothetical protein
MGMALVKRNTDGDDPTRSTLRAAIAARAAAEAKAGQQQEAIHRARNMVTAAEAKAGLAGEALESCRADHAQALAEAATTGSTPKANGALRSARAALSDAEDEASAARAALDRLEADGDDLKAANSQLENAVLVAIAEVIAPVAERLLAQIQRKQIELSVLQQLFLALTDDDEAGAPLFPTDVRRLNAKDARMKPVTALREQLFNLDLKAGQERAKEAAAAWRKWRESLRRDSDVPLPELPA